MDPSRADRPPLLVLNPQASHLRDEARRRRVTIAAVSAIRHRCHQDPDVIDGSHAEALAALATAAGRPLVVVAGGDGSVREAAAVLAGTGTAMAVIPGGTGNVLAHAVKVGGRERALVAIRSGTARDLDLGVARWREADGSTTERHFVVACGMGLDARIMMAAEEEWKRRLRFGAYVGAAIREATRLQHAVFRIRADGEDFETIGLVALVANCGEIVPGRVGARQPLDPTDGRLDLIVAGGRGVVDGVQGVARVLLSRGDLDGSVIRRSVRHVAIEAEPPQPRQTDGDPHPPGALEARVVPAAVRLLVPA